MSSFPMRTYVRHLARFTLRPAEAETQVSEGMRTSLVSRCVGEPFGRLQQNLEPVIGVGGHLRQGVDNSFACGQPISSGSSRSSLTISSSAQAKRRTTASSLFFVREAAKVLSEPAGLLLGQ
jgi:hypothetical protein